MQFIESDFPCLLSMQHTLPLHRRDQTVNKESLTSVLSVSPSPLKPAHHLQVHTEHKYMNTTASPLAIPFKIQIYVYTRINNMYMYVQGGV